jgi:hypothetical protein
MIGYLAEAKDKKVSLSWEHDYFEWVSIEKALSLEWPSVHLAFLKKAISLKTQLVSKYAL